MQVRKLALIAGLALASAGIPVLAQADEVDPNFLSTLESVTPSVQGLETKLLKRGDELLVENRTGKVLVVTGYGDEPYLRFLPNGKVEENQNSPATYLNRDRFATQKVPDFADTDAKPRWKVVGDEGELEWHDHRVHYMGKETPRQVKDESKRQKVFDWKVEMALAGKPVELSGTLFWIPTATDEDDGGFPILVVVIALLVLLAGLGLVALRRRTPAPQPAPRPSAEPPPETDKEAW